MVQFKAPPHRHMNDLPRFICTADHPLGHIFALLLTARVEMESARPHWFLPAEAPRVCVNFRDKFSFVFKFSVVPFTWGERWKHCCSVWKSLCMRPMRCHSWGAGMAQWWEHSSPTNVARVRSPHPSSYLHWVCCWFSSFLRKVLIRAFRFSPLLKNQHFQIPRRSGLLSSILPFRLWLGGLCKHSPCYWHQINYFTLLLSSIKLNNKANYLLDLVAQCQV